MLHFLVVKNNEKIQEVIEQSKHETELPVIDDRKLRTILSDAGVSDEKLEGLSAVYTDTVGKAGLTASNLVETKTVVATPEITINIKNGATDKIRTSLIQGRKCLIIDLDDPSIMINGLSTNLGFSELQTVT